MRVARLLCVAVAAATLAGASPAAAAGLRAGAGKADITPRTGYYLGGWTRADRVAGGQHTRLFARTLVLERDGRKLALVSIDLFMVGGGMVKHIGDALADRGFSERNILISASHTHSGPGGYANFPTLNTAAPSLQTATDPVSFYKLFNPEPADPALYAFLLRQITLSIRRADDDLGAAAAGWGSSEIAGLTRNRSLEAHLANHGLELEYGEGKESDDPGGYLHTIDPAVNVLRVDKVVRRGRRRVRVPIGAWSTFADHGTVTKSSFTFYNADHHGSALRVFEARVRRAGRVRARQEIVNVYGNSNEGDMSAGLDRHGPAASDFVGRIEAAAMFRAWRSARLSRTPELDVRWTRMCFCGQTTSAGPTPAQSEVGMPFFTGSEEERGPLFDVTQEHFEGRRAPNDDPEQGHKIVVTSTELPRGVPLFAVRIGKRVIVTIPAEGTKEVGDRLRAAIASAVAGSGVERVVVAGLVNEFILYLTTPEEFQRQHYEGGNTHYGKNSSVLVTEELAKLAGRLVRGEPAPEPLTFDPTNGVSTEGPAYGDGAETGSIIEEPASAVERLQRVKLRWQGGPQGIDRPLDAPFVVAERRRGKRWVQADSDLGLAMLWKVDDAGVHEVVWEVPRNAVAGRYRLRVSAKRYTLTSREFAVVASRALRVVAVDAPAGRVAVSLRYPGAVRDVDLTYRPPTAMLRSVTFRVGGRTMRVKGKSRRVVSVRARSGPVTVAAGAARDRYGNTNADAIEVR